jgi:hypothetical protein
MRFLNGRYLAECQIANVFIETRLSLPLTRNDKTVRRTSHFVRRVEADCYGDENKTGISSANIFQLFTGKGIKQPRRITTPADKPANPSMLQWCSVTASQCACRWLRMLLDGGRRRRVLIPIWRTFSAVTEAGGQYTGHVPGFNVGLSLVSGMGGLNSLIVNDGQSRNAIRATLQTRDM